MSYEIRPITEDEYLALSKVLEVAFGDTDPEAEHEKPIFEFDRSIGVFDGDRVVGSAGAYTFELTLPGNTTTQVAGVTWVGVLSTYRRQGILRSMMAHQLADVRERGEALAVLTASEGSIYGRFGYGQASINYSAEIRRPVEFRSEVPLGRMTMVDKDEAGKVLPGLYDRWRQRTPGAISRRPEWWDVHLADPKKYRDGMSGRFYAIHESQPGQPDGYVAYRTKNGWDSNALPNGELKVEDLVALTPDAHAALWRYVLEVDLMAKVTIRNLAIDDPIRWRFEDPRRLRVTNASDFLWARILDVPAALAARRYEGEGRLVIDVVDDFIPELSGRYQLEGGPDGAQAAATDADADIRVHIVDLGAAYLGAAPFTTLVGAGRAEELTPGALRRADAMFRSVPAAFCNTGF